MILVVKILCNQLSNFTARININLESKMLKNIKTTYVLAIAAALFSVNGANAKHHKMVSDVKAQTMVVDNAWARASNAATKTGAGYVHLVNKGDKDDYLVAVKDAVSAQTELHQMTLVDNVMKCKLLKEPILIKAHSEFTLKPGAYHIMFTNLKKPLVKGESFPAVFTFKHSAPVKATFAISAAAEVTPPVKAVTKAASKEVVKDVVVVVPQETPKPAMSK